jgi:Uma2 family endonuclease
MNEPLKRMTAEEFATWAEAQDQGRFELIDGVVVEMNSEAAVHARTKRRIANLLEAALMRAGVDGEVFGDGMAVKITERIVHEPDAMLRLGPRLPDAQNLVFDPVIVVEVVSPRSGPVDTSTKLVNYMSLPSVMHYLVVRTNEQIVLHYQRGPDGKPALTTLTEGPLHLAPPGLTIQVAEIFA